MNRATKACFGIFLVVVFAIVAASGRSANAFAPVLGSALADVQALPQQTSFAPVAEIAQAQSQTFQPEPVPPAPPQGGSNQTLTLPQAAPQSSLPPTLELPQSQGHEGSLEVPMERQPKTAVGRISITATDTSGRWVQNLRKQDITIYEDGIQRPVFALQRDFDTPASIGIVVDTSGSMSWKLPAAKAALQHFVRTLNPRDQVFLSAFSDRSYLLQDFTDSSAALNHAIGLLHAWGRTALYDAVVQGLQRVEHGRWPKKTLLVMTDGIDNSSSYSLDNAIQAARRGGVLIYTVGLGTTGSSRGARAPITITPFFGGGMRLGGGFGGRRRGGDDERVDAATLRTLSDETGATTFILDPRVTDLSALDTHFQTISAELREQYTARYASAGGDRPHQIRVEGVRPGVEVRAPKWAGNGAGEAGG